MVRAVFFDSDENEGIYLESEISQSGAMNPASWAGTPVKVAGLDPAFTNGGDRTILFTGQVGYSSTGQFVFEFGKLFQLTDDSSNKAVPRTYQIVTQVMNICKKEGVSPDNLQWTPLVRVRHSAMSYLASGPPKFCVSPLGVSLRTNGCPQTVGSLALTSTRTVCQNCGSWVRN